MEALFSSRQWNSNPLAYWSVSYEYQRNGADMQYRFWYKVWFSSTGAWYNNILVLPMYLNGVNIATFTVKPQTSGSGLGPYEYTSGWYTVSNVTSGTVPFYCQLVDKGFGSGWTVKDTSPTYNLTVSPAYTTINTFTVSKISGYEGLTKVLVNWATAHTIDYLWYSTDNGTNWTGLDVTDSVSGNFNISGLNPNTGYNFKIRVRRKDSQLNTDSGAYYQNTYAINSISSSNPNISNGSSLNVTANNPSGSSCQIRLETIINGVTVSRYTKSGSSVTFSISEINNLLQYAPNNPTFTIRVVADTLNGETIGYSNWKDGTYTIVNSNPTFINFEYEDSNLDIVDVTDNNQLIVKNKSNLRIKVSSLNKMIALNGSTPIRYDISAGNRSGSLDYSAIDSYIDLGTINISGPININVNAVDSRGFKTLKTIVIDVLDYFDPTINTILGRINNFENNTSILASGQYASLSSKNIITGIYYRYKLTTVSNWDNIDWIPFIITQSNGNYSSDTKNVILDNQSSFNFQVKVTDSINTVGIIENYELDEGIPIAFINATRKNMGIGCLNEAGEEYSFEVKNKIYSENGKKVLVEGEANFKIPLDSYPIGALYQSAISTNPATLFGGTWVQDRTYYGGELIAYGLVSSVGSTGSSIASGVNTAFSDTSVGNKTYNVINYIDGIITGTGGALLIQTKGIVGMVEAEMFISGLGATGIKGFWWQGSGSALPTGVSLVGVNSRNVLATGPIDGNYGGNNNKYMYKVDSTSDLQFFVNPMFAPYNGAFTPSAGGVICHLWAKVFAKYGITYTWKRTA